MLRVGFWGYVYVAVRGGWLEWVWGWAVFVWAELIRIRARARMMRWKCVWGSGRGGDVGEMSW